MKVKSMQDGEMTILFGEEQFRKRSNCFDSKKWTVVQISPAGKNELKPSPLQIEKVIANLNMTHELTGLEKDCNPLVNWLYSFHGRFGQLQTQKEIYVLLTADLLEILGLAISSRKNADRTITRLADCDPKFKLFSYINLFTRETIPGEEDTSQIFNPLSTRPAGDKVVAVPKGLLCKAFSNCTTDVARGLGDFMAKCFELFLSRIAVKHAKSVPVEEFKETVVEPTEAALRVDSINRFNKDVAKLKAESDALKFELSRMRTELLDYEAQTINQSTVLAEKTARIRELEIEQMEKEGELIHKSITVKKMEAKLETKDRQLYLSAKLLRLTEIEKEKSEETFTKFKTRHMPVISHYPDDPYKSQIKGGNVVAIASRKGLYDRKIGDDEVILLVSYAHPRTTDFKPGALIGNLKHKISTRCRECTWWKPMAYFIGTLEPINFRDRLLELADRKLADGDSRRESAAIVKRDGLEEKIEKVVKEFVADRYAAAFTEKTTELNVGKMLDEEERKEYEALAEKKEEATWWFEGK